MEEPAIINLVTYQELKDQMGADFMIELVDTYCLETGELIEQLRHTLAAGDSGSFGRLAHSIKSSSASLGALGFSQQARELEMLGKTNDLSGAGPKLDRLAADFINVKRELEALRNEP